MGVFYLDQFKLIQCPSLRNPRQAEHGCAPGHQVVKSDRIAQHAVAFVWMDRERLCRCKPDGFLAFEQGSAKRFERGVVPNSAERKRGRLAHSQVGILLEHGT